MPKKTDQSHKKNWGAQIPHGVARKQDLGNTNTPMNLAKAIVEQFLDGELSRQVQDPGRWLEPAVGTGNFYLAVLEAAKNRGIDPWEMASVFDAVDIDEEAIIALKNRLQDTYGWSKKRLESLPIFCTSLVDWEKAGSYRVILTNPPYLAPKNWAADPVARKAMLSKWQTVVPGLDPRSDLFLYFFRWCHSHLEPGGASLFLCSDGWIDSSYGQALRNDFLGDKLTLETVYSWPWASLFRDDTCPIITIVRNTETRASKGNTTLVVDDGSPLDKKRQAIYKSGGGVPSRQIQTMTPELLSQWLGEDVINRRARIVSGPLLHAKVEKALSSCSPKMAPFGTLAQVTGFSWSINDVERGGLLVAQPGATGKRGQDQHPPPDDDLWKESMPLFFQKQARVGKPVDYRQARTENMLGCRIALGRDALSEKIRKNGERMGGAWISLAIDRFPLVFFQADTPTRPWIGVSKYAHASLIRNDEDNLCQIDTAQEGALLCALLTNTLSILAIERRLKEGTRKTLRVNENGYAKEVTRGSLAALPVPDWRRWSQSVLQNILSLQAARSVKNLHRLDHAVQDQDWVALDNAIGMACGLDNQTMNELRNLALASYWRRMRNILEYGPAINLVFSS